MTGVAVVALVASADAGLAKTKQQPAPAASSAPTPVAAPSNAELDARVSALEAELAAAEEHTTADHTRLSTLEQNFNDTSWSFDNGRPTVKSGDGRFTMAFRVRFQSDFAGFMQDSTHPAGFAGPTDLSSGAVVRRAYFGVEGKVFNDFAYELRLNGGGTNGGSNGASGGVTGSEGDALVNKAVVTYTGITNVHFNVGVIEPAFMFEGTTSSASLMFLERPEIDNIAADSFGAGDSRRGIELGWAKQDTLWSGDNLAATMAFTGGKTGTATNHGSLNTNPGDGDENSQLLGRVSERLWTDGARSNIQIGASGATVLYSGSNGNTNGGAQTLNFQDRPEIRVDGTRLISTGGIAAKTGHMWAVDAGGNYENFFLGGEYSQFTMDRQCGATLTPALNPACVAPTSVKDHPNFSGWYLEGSWILTGEAKTYSPSAINNEVGGFNAPVPSRPFSFSGDSWGAWELAARYSDTDLNWNTTQLASPVQLAGITGGDERVLALAVNWYLNRNVRVMLDDNIVTVKKGTALIPNRDGQDLNIVGVRVQFAN
ncbi:MAG TPA: porin [Rhizomicrobium sp.]|nr:porin [Rhizomicrobium sp.]